MCALSIVKPSCVFHNYDPTYYLISRNTLKSTTRDDKEVEIIIHHHHLISSSSTTPSSSASNREPTAENRIKAESISRPTFSLFAFRLRPPWNTAPNNPSTSFDRPRSWKIYLATTLYQDNPLGIFCLVFHPHRLIVSKPNTQPLTSDQRSTEQ